MKQAVPEILEEGDKSWFKSFNWGKALSAWLECIDETDEKVFCLQYKLSVSLALL